MHEEALKIKDIKFEELGKLAQLATASAERYKEQCKNKDQQLGAMAKQLDMARKQFIAVQTKLKTVASSVVPELTQNLESKIKEVEMLKEMLRSNKIELSGKEREIRRLKGKLNVVPQVKVRAKQRTIEKDSRKALIKNTSMTRESKTNTTNIEENPYMAPGDNFFFKQNYEDSKQFEELGNMKELELNNSLEQLRGMTELNIDIPDMASPSELHLPSISSASQRLNNE